MTGARPDPHRQLLRLLRRPPLGRPGDGRGRPDRRPHRRLAGRADDADPVEGAGAQRRPAATPARSSRRWSRCSARASSGGIKVVTQRRRAQPRRLRRRASATSADKPRRVAVNVAHVEGDDLMDRVDGLAAAACANLDTGEPLTADPVTRQRLPRRLGHRRRAGRRAPTSSSARGSPTPPSWSGRRRGGAAGRRPTGTASPAPWSPATSSSAAPRRPAATTPSSRSSPSSARPLGLPDRRDRRRRLVGHHQAPGHRRPRRPSAPSPRSCCTRSGRRRTPTPTSSPASTPSSSSEVGADRVRISGRAAQPAPPTAKVAINYEGGFRNKMTFVLTGLDQEAQGRRGSTSAVRHGDGRRGSRFDDGSDGVRFVPAPSDGADQERSQRPAARARQGARRAPRRTGVLVGRRRAGPGQLPRLLHDHPARAGVGVRRLLAGARAASTSSTRPSCSTTAPACASTSPPTGPASEQPIEPPTVAADAAHDRARRRRSARYFGARSGDKGGNANVGIWARDDAGYAWLAANLDDRRVRRLIPEAAELDVHRYELPNLRALNFVLVGYLGEGVAASTAFDPQAKGLGEYLRSRTSSADAGRRRWCPRRAATGPSAGVTRDPALAPAPTRRRTAACRRWVPTESCATLRRQQGSPPQRWSDRSERRDVSPDRVGSRFRGR